MATQRQTAASASTVSALMGAMSTAKEKWDASGANDAMNRISASVPQGTKDYFVSATGQVFNKQKLRSVSVCFGIGEERAFYVEKAPALLVARVKHNLTFFYLNYMMLTAALFCLTLVISPTAVIGIGLLGALWLYVIRQTQNGAMLIYGVPISARNATIGMGVFSAVVLIYLLSSIFWWTLGSSALLVAAHAALRDASMHQDGDDEVAMVGEFSGESAAFLGEP